MASNIEKVWKFVAGWWKKWSEICEEMESGGGSWKVVAQVLGTEARQYINAVFVQNLVVNGHKKYF